MSDKIHMAKEWNRTMCSMSGHTIQMTLDPEKVTCKMCRWVMGKKAVKLNPKNHENNRPRRRKDI